MEPAQLAGYSEDDAEDADPFGQKFVEQRGDGDATHEKAHGDGEAGSAEGVGKIVERQYDGWSLCDDRMDQRPHGKTGCHAVEYDQKAAKKSDPGSG